MAAPKSKLWPTRYMSHDEEYGLPRVRKLVGPGPSDMELMDLLSKAGHCVSVAACMFWGEGPVDDADADADDDDDDDRPSWNQDSSDSEERRKDEEFENSLQVRYDCFFDGRPFLVGELNAMAAELADAGETGALMQIWDELKGSKGASPATWVAVERLHARGKGKIPSGTLRLSEDRPPQAMAPARRLHKICKGRRLSARSSAVDSTDEVLPRGIDWVRGQQASGSSLVAAGGKQRMAIAKELVKALGIDLETARGLVTKLKRKKVL